MVKPSLVVLYKVRDADIGPMFNPKHVHIREDTFLLGGGGGSGPGLRRGGSLVNFLQIGKGQTCFFVFQPGEGHSFLARKNYSMSLLFCSVQAKLPVKINLNYLQVWKNLYIKKLSSPN